jgi:GNAT superfamily N-acetyltransferase
VAADPDALTWEALVRSDDVVQVASGIELDAPPFLAEVTAPQRAEVTARFPHQQWLVSEGGLPVAVVRAVPLRWSGARGDAPAGGVAEALGRAGETDADTLAVLDVVVAYGARARGVGGRVLAHLEERGRSEGFGRTLLLARPHAKQDNPLVPFARYASFTDPLGLPFDPWFRAAWRRGLVPVRGVERSLIVRTDLSDWVRWLGRPIPGSGPYLVPGALKPAILETERAEGRYREPHLWMAPRDALTEPTPDAWPAALAAAGVSAGDRSHREVRRSR